MKLCTQCNHALRPESKFCMNCGAAAQDNAVSEAINQQQGNYVPPVQQEPSDPPPAQQQGSYAPPIQQEQSDTLPPQYGQGSYAGAAYAGAPAPKQKKPINKKIFIFGGAALALVLVAALVIVLLGGKKDVASPVDPNIGIKKPALSGDAKNSKSDLSDPDADDALSESEDGVQSKWNGTWYGYIWITEAFGVWEEYEDLMSNAYLVIQVDEEGEGTMAIFLEDNEDQTVDAYIKADISHFEVTEGEFWDMPLDPAVWWIGLSPVDEGRLFVISDTYIDPEHTGGDGFTYMFVFRPFGELWEQEQREDEKLPPGYDDYVSSLESGATDPYAHGGGNSKKTPDAGTPTAIPPAKVAPHFTTAELKAIYQKLDQAYGDFSLKDLVYEEVRDKFFNGADGELYMDSQTLSQYYWYAVGSDEEAYISVTFQDYGNGKKTAGGLGSYLP